MKTFTKTDGNINIKAVRADDRINTRGSSGVDAWAIYGEIDGIGFAEAADETPDVLVTLRFLAAGNALFYQLKKSDSRAAGWQFKPVDSTEALNNALELALPSHLRFELRGAPIVGQLVATDVESITHRNEAPQGRYTFKATYEKLYGKGV